MAKIRYTFEVQNDNLTPHEIKDLTLYFMSEETKINTFSKYRVHLKSE